MGRPSDKRRAAQRPGKRERARVKKARRWYSSCYVGGAVHYHVSAGRTKHSKVSHFLRRAVDAHLGGDSATLKSAISAGRPLYKVEIVSAPLSESHNQFCSEE